MLDIKIDHMPDLFAYGYAVRRIIPKVFRRQSSRYLDRVKYYTPVLTTALRGSWRVGDEPSGSDGAGFYLVTNVRYALPVLSRSNFLKDAARDEGLKPIALELTSELGSAWSKL